MNNIIKKRRRIGIDARFYGPIGKGLGRYVQEVVDNILKLDADSDNPSEYVIFLSPENFSEFSSTHPFVKKCLISLRWYSWREQIILPFIFYKEHLDLLHFPHFNVPIFTPVPFVVTIHDLILTRFPSRRASMLPAALYWLKQLAYRLVISVAVRRAQAIITVSEFTRRDIINQFHAKPKKLFVTYEGVADLNKKSDIASVIDDDVLHRYGIRHPFLLYVGNAYPHKNLERLLAVFARIYAVNSDLHLVMVGKNDYFYQRVKNKAHHLGLWSEDRDKNAVVFPGYVPDEYLDILYRRALVYVFPSLYEGFGLPPLEAMSRGCPVASSNQASLPEIIGEAAMYFNPYDQEEMVEKLEQLILDDDRRRQLSIQGRQHVLAFSWLKCAQKTLEIYHQVLSV